MKVQSGKILEPLFAEKKILTWSELTSTIARSSLRSMVANEKLLKLTRGRYALPTYTETSEYSSWAMVSQRSPNGVVCLLSALKYHGLTLQNPYQLWWAIPEGYHPPKVDYPTLKVVILSSDCMAEGEETVVVDDMEMKVFNPTKTVADCFKFRNKIGLHIAVEALTDSWEKKKLDLNLLWKYAEINRVQRIIQPYLDTLK